MLTPCLRARASPYKVRLAGDRWMPFRQISEDGSFFTLCFGARTLEGAETNRACAVSSLPPLSRMFMGCFSCFKTRLIGLSQCVHFFLGVSMHLSNPYPLSLCTKMERIWSWGQARPGFKPWTSGLCLTFLIWKMGKQWAPRGRIISHEAHLAQCLAHNNWAAA